MVVRPREAASYESLATKLAKAKIDKSSRFTDWSRRRSASGRSPMR